MNKTWTAPKITDLDVRLTEKNPGSNENIANWGTGNWHISTYASDVSNNNTPDLGAAS